jgi:hypothetical protein
MFIKNGRLDIMAELIKLYGKIVSIPVGIIMFLGVLILFWK